MHSRPIQRLARLIALAALSGCGDDPPPPAPTVDEIALVTEALIIESTLQDFNGVERDRLADRYYGQLYDKYGERVADLGELRTRYAHRPELWTAAADSAIARIDRHRGDPLSLLTLSSDGGNSPADTLARD